MGVVKLSVPSFIQSIVDDNFHPYLPVVERKLDHLEASRFFSFIGRFVIWRRRNALCQTDRIKNISGLGGTRVAVTCTYNKNIQLIYLDDLFEVRAMNQRYYYFSGSNFLIEKLYTDSMDNNDIEILSNRMVKRDGKA